MPVVTSNKDGADSVAAKEIVDADVVISQPFWPFYLTRELIRNIFQLQQALDQITLICKLIDNDVDVVEVTYCNSISVSEHIVMMILSMRDYHNQHSIAKSGGWNIADAVRRSYDFMHIGTVAAGRIGLAAKNPMKPFETNLLLCIDRIT